MPLLEVTDLRTHLFTDDGVVKAVDGVSFALSPAEAVGLVGESGCGKSMLALSLLRLVPHPPGRIVGGRVLLAGAPDRPPVDLLTLPEREMRAVRGKRIAMVFQEPMTSLNPVQTIGDQIGEAVVLHEGLPRAAVRRRVEEMLTLVGIPEPARRMRNYPHEFSGGMRQRAMIAMALACRPALLIADEPTTALDVTIQAQILDLLRRLQAELRMALLLVTHDLGVVAEMARRVLVMYAGRVVEEGTVEQIFREAAHPYTQGLLRSIPPSAKLPAGSRFATIPGTVPNLARLPAGCAFADRCPRVQPRCRQEEVPEDPCNVGRLVRCFHAGPG